MALRITPERLFSSVRLKTQVRSDTCESLLLATRKRVFELSERHLITKLVFFQLVLYVLRNSAFVLSYRIHIVPFTPKLSISVLIFQFAELLIQHRATLSFQVSHEARNRHLRRYFHQHMHMVRAYFCFHYLYAFPQIRQLLWSRVQESNLFWFKSTLR